MDRESKLIVGSEEWCAFPGLGIPAIKARVDSGAKTSSLHAFNIQTFSRGSRRWVSFEVHPIERDRKTTVRCEAPLADRRLVKSSSGDREKRYVISAPLHIGGDAFDIELTLTNRDSMGYRMLLGREAMSGRMLVDPAAGFCLGEVSEAQLGQLYGGYDSASSGLKIGLLASDSELYSNQRLMEVGEDRGHEMLFLNIRQCYIKLNAGSPQVQCSGGHILDDLDAVIPRVPPGVTAYGSALIRHLESIGVFSLNSAAAIALSRDTLHGLQLLQSKGLGIPTTAIASSPVDTRDLVEMVGGAPLIVRSLWGTPGRGAVLAETRKAAESVINASRSPRANLLLQEFLKEAGGRDRRCFILNGKVVSSVERTAAAGEFRAGERHGGTAAPAKLSAEERRLAVKAARTLGLQVAGVDIIHSREGPLVLKVNASPGLEEIEAATGKDLAGKMIEAVERKLAWVRTKVPDAAPLS